MTKTSRKRQFCQRSSFPSNFSNKSLNTIYTGDNQISCTDNVFYILIIKKILFLASRY